MTKLKLAALSLLALMAAGGWFWFDHNVDWAARVAWGEARGEPNGGMQAVLNVMVNRKRDPRFPSSLVAVAKQHRQFSAYNHTDPNRPKLEKVAEDDPQFKQAKRLATFAQLGVLWDVTDGATYYHSNTIARPVYLERSEVTARVGNHVFYRYAD